MKSSWKVRFSYWWQHWGQNGMWNHPNIPGKQHHPRRKGPSGAFSGSSPFHVKLDKRIDGWMHIKTMKTTNKIEIGEKKYYFLWENKQQTYSRFNVRGSEFITDGWWVLWSVSHTLSEPAIPKHLLQQFHLFSEQPRQNHLEYNNLVLNFHIHLALKS